MTTTVSDDGQVTIPKAIRDLMGLEPGTQVEFRLATDGTIVLTRADQQARNRFEALRGCAKTTMTTDEIMTLTRGEV